MIKKLFSLVVTGLFVAMTANPKGSKSNFIFRLQTSSQSQIMTVEAFEKKAKPVC